jgi:hypothetical protein
MQTTIRYCRRCGGNMDQWLHGIGRWLPWSMVLIGLMMAPLLWWLDPWH